MFENHDKRKGSTSPLIVQAGSTYVHLETLNSGTLKAASLVSGFSTGDLVPIFFEWMILQHLFGSRWVDHTLELPIELYLQP